MSDVKIVGRAIPRQFDTYKLGVKGNAPADGELIYEIDEEALVEMRVAAERVLGEDDARRAERFSKAQPSDR